MAPPYVDCRETLYTTSCRRCTLSTEHRQVLQIFTRNEVKPSTCDVDIGRRHKERTVHACESSKEWPWRHIHRRSRFVVSSLNLTYIHVATFVVMFPALCRYLYAFDRTRLLQVIIHPWYCVILEKVTKDIIINSIVSSRCNVRYFDLYICDVIFEYYSTSKSRQEPRDQGQA